MNPEIRNLKFLFPIIGMLLCAVPSFAADVKMTIEPQLISLLDRAVLKVEFTDCKDESVDIPEIAGLQIKYLGPSKNFNFINGRTSSKIVHTYVITPSKMGDYSIGPVVAKFKGGEKTLAGQLRVSKKADDQEAQQLSEIMFAKISSNRKQPYVHEPFSLEVKISVRDNVQIASRFGIQGGLPESGLDGELMWDVRQGKREEINGSIFNTYYLRTTTKALTGGMFTFQPQVQVNIVVPRQNRRPFGFDDPFFGDFLGRQETRPVILDCNKLDLEVKPIPMEGRPQGFTGGVGVLDFSVSAGPKTVKAGEPVTVKMRISGRGNLSKITPPIIEENHDFKLYDARTVETDSPNEVLFEQVVIPKSDSVTNIPEIVFSYFNTQTSDFRTIAKGPFPITVEEAPYQVAQVISTTPGTVQQETKVLGRDIVYLKPMPKKWRSANDALWYETAQFRILLSLPALLLLAATGISVRRNALAGNVALARRQQAPKSARKHIQQAEQALRKNDNAAFYEALWNALTNYFGHRLNLPPGDVTQQTVCDHIPQEAEMIRSLFDTVEQRRYGFGASGADDMKPLLKRLTETMKKCERMKL